jgi:hypothetical protein
MIFQYYPDDDMLYIKLAYQPHGYPVGARAWIPARSLRE